MIAQDKLKLVAESLGVSFIFENWTLANIAIDKTTFPVIVYVLPASGELNFKNGNIRDNQNGMIAFLDKVVLYGNGQENDSVVDRMKSLAIKFIVELNKTGDFEPFGGTIGYKVVYDKLDANVSGIVIETTLKEVNGICERNV